MQNVWESLHPLVDLDVKCDLVDYSSIFIDKDVVLALKEGLKEAQKMMRILNMAPSSTKAWFITLWVLEKLDPKYMAFVSGKCLVLGEDGDNEVLRETLF